MNRPGTVLSFLVVTLLFGTAFPAIKAGLAYLPPLSFAAARYYVSAAVLLTYAAVTTEYWYPRTRRERLAVLAGGALFIGGTGFTFVGQQYIESGLAAIIVSLLPILTVAFGWALLPAERPSRRGVVGVLVGFVGVVLVVRPSPAVLADPAVLGRSLVTLAAVLIALGSVLVRRSRADLPIPALTAWAMVLGATLQAVAAAATGETLAAVDPTPVAVAAVVYLGVFAGALAFALYFSLIETVGALEANLVSYLNPLVAVGTGWLLFGERLQAVAFVGFAVVVLGFALLKNHELAAELARYRGGGR